MAFVGYQEDAGENGVLVDASVRSSQATAPGFVQGLTFQQVVNGTDKSIFDRLTDPKNMGSFNAAVQDQGFVQLGISKRSSINQLKAFTGVSIEKDAGWNPIESIKGLGPSFEGNYEQLMNTQNEEDFKLLVEDIQNAKNRNKVFDSAGYDGTATVAAMLTDPTNYIPIAPGASMINKALRATALRGVKGRIALPAHAVSPFDRDIAIRTIWGEARNQGDNGMAAVAHVMMNRLASGNYGKSLSEIALAKNQFEPWGNAATKKAMEKLSPSSPEYKRIGSILDQVMTGHLPDITNGADMFYAPKAQAAMGRKPPSWGTGTPIARVGDHDFFHSGGNPVDQARKQSIQAANATFWTTEASASLEVFGQLMANPDYSASDAIGVMGSATMLGLGGGAIVRTMGDLRANKMALDQNSYNNLLRKKLDSLNGYGDAPETFSVKSMAEAINKGDDAFIAATDDWFTNRDTIFKNLNDSIGRDAKSVGAMAITSTDPVEVYRVSGVAKFLRYTNPILDTVVGQSNSAKRIMGGLFENNLLTNENMKGISTNTGGAVSTRVRVQMGRLATFQDDLGNQFKAFQKEMMNQNKTPMGRAQFEREVWLHTFGASSMSDNPFIQRAADRFKKDITHPTLKNAQEVGLIKKGAGEDYSPVIFNRQAIRADRSNFSDAVRRAVLKGYDDYQVNPKGKKEPSFDPYTEKEKFDKFVDEYTEFWATQTDTAVVGMETKSGRTKMRVDFPMAYTEMQDYMENTIGEVASRYMRSMTPDIEMLRTYKSLDLKNEIKVVTKEYDDLIAAASNDVARKSLEKEKARVLDNINWSVKNIRNRDDYSMMTSEGMRTAIKALNLWTFTKGMGMFPINAMAESSIPVLIHGYANTYGQIMKDYSNEFKGMKMAKELAMSSGIATDKALGDRMTAIMDGTNGAIDQNTLERRIDRFMGGAAKLFGMPYINDTFRTMSTMWNNNMFGKDIATIASGRGKMDDMARARYANLGIDQEVAVRLMDQMEKHGEWIEGNFVPNLENWNAKDALAYRSALLKAVDNEFLIPQAADMPKFAQTPIGKPLFFLRSYTFTATNRLALAGMQRGLSPEMAKGMAGVLAMGMLSNALYQAANGRDQPEGVEMIYGAMDRAGIFGLFWEANNLMDRTVGIGLGDGERAMEYSNPIEQIGGPNAYTIGDAVDFIGQPSMGSAGDLMPLGNWLPLEAAKRVLIQ